MAMRSTRRRLVLIGAGALAAGLLVPAVANGATATAVWGDFDRSVQYNWQYPATVTVSKGDKVAFEIRGFHTVVIPGRRGTNPPLAIPTNRLSPAADDPAGAPYWWGGTAPILQINPAAAAPSGGTVARRSRTVNSGIPRGSKFTVTFPEKGTFEIRCAVHPNMKGKVRVVNRSGDTAAKRRARAAREKAAQRATARRMARAADRATTPTVTIGPGTAKAYSMTFNPANRRIPVGGTVTWTMGGRNELHTVTFGPPAELRRLEREFLPTGGGGLDLGSETVYPSDPPAAGVPSLTPTSHGNGLLNSGLLADPRTAPLPRRFSVTFPTAGRYDYICIVHTNMRGTITVG